MLSTIKLRMDFCIMLLGVSFVLANAATVNVWVGYSNAQYIQDSVIKYGPGTTFMLKATDINGNRGIHRGQQIDPLAGDVFIGDKDASGNKLTILNGSQQLSTMPDMWTSIGNNVYMYGNVVEFDYNPYPTHGIDEACDDASKCPCYIPENLFWNNALMTKVANKSQLTTVTPGTTGNWFFEGTITSTTYYAQGLVYVYRVGNSNPPAGTDVIEIGQKRLAFGTACTPGHTKAAANVTIQDLIIEKYASLYQMGVIGNQVCGDSWTIFNNEIRLNGGAGINAGSQALVKNNYVHDNSQIGIKVSLADKKWADNALVIGNTIAFNGRHEGGFRGWEAGGTKFSYTRNIRITQNVLYKNCSGGAIWFDMNNLNALADNNYAYDNEGPGLWYEASDGPATIRYNTFRNNATNGLGANIHIDNSMNANVYNNLVVVGSKGNGITMGETKTHCCDNKNNDPCRNLRNNFVHDNQIFFTSSPTSSSGNMGFLLFNCGIITCDGGLPSCTDANFYTLVGDTKANNIFNSNRYHMPNTSAARWYWQNGANTLANFKTNTFNIMENNTATTTIDTKTVSSSAMARNFFPCNGNGSGIAFMLGN
jgi:hypothetical protein